jgi:hypothetical protein
MRTLTEHLLVLLALGVAGAMCLWQAIDAERARKDAARSERRAARWRERAREAQADAERSLAHADALLAAAARERNARWLEAAGFDLRERTS